MPRGPRRSCAVVLARRAGETHAGLADVAQALARFLGETPVQELDNVPRRPGGDARPVRLALEHAGEDVAHRLAVEGELSSEALVEDAAEGPHVDALVDRLAAGLLGRHVRRRAEQAALLGRDDAVLRHRGGARLARRLRETEV